VLHQVGVSFDLLHTKLLLVGRVYCCELYCMYCCHLMCIYCTVCVCIVDFTLDAGLLVRSQYSEGPVTGHLDTGFSWFPCA